MSLTTSEPQRCGAPVVTIGLPVFNGGRFVEEAINSIRQQTFERFDVLIADNASSDNTVKICRRYASLDSRVRLIESDTNRGAAWNFNRTVHEASGRYFKWAAHDDVIAPQLLERCVAVLDAEPEVVLCYGHTYDIDEHGEPIGRIESRPYATEDNPVERVRSLFDFDSSCVEVFGLVRTDALATTGLIGAYTSSDRTLLFELAMRGRFHEIPIPLLYRRQHSGRSVRSSARDRNAWFDPDRGEVFTFPRWRLAAEYFRSIRRAPLDRSSRRAINLLTARWAARQLPTLVREVAAWLLHRLRAHGRRAANDARSPRIKKGLG